MAMIASIVYQWLLQSSLNKVGHIRKSKQIAGCTEIARMSSKLLYNFQASQAMHGADDITTPHF